MPKNLNVLNFEDTFCASCQGACCRARTMMTLGDSDAEFIKASGTELTKIADMDIPLQGVRRVMNAILGTNPPEARGVYRLENDCGYLIQDGDQFKCSEINNPKRPPVCWVLDSGGYWCRGIREGAGVDPSGSFETWLSRTQS